MGPAIIKDCLEDQEVTEVLLVDIDAERLDNVDLRYFLVLYFGDFDPSGVDIERDLSERLGKYNAGDFTVVRVALTDEQITKYDLPPMPVKTSDARSEAFLEAYGNKSVELDALDPNILKLMVAQSISSHINLDAWIKKEKEIENLKLWIKGKLENMEDLISE